MKILARVEHEDAYILRATGSEVRLIARIEGALEGETSNDAMQSPDCRGKLKLPDHEKMIQILWNFLSALRSHNDFASSFENLKGLLKNEGSDK